jgi:hypothetical protein
MEKTVSVKTESDTVKVRTDSNTKRFNAHLEHKASNETDAAISFINSNVFGWKADTCKL